MWSLGRRLPPHYVGTRHSMEALDSAACLWRLWEGARVPEDSPAGTGGSVLAFGSSASLVGLPRKSGGNHDPG